MIAPADLAHCRAAIRTGSLSFHAASRLLPNKVRDPALVLYAFCRLADDAVDEASDDAATKATAVLGLRDRLDLVYQGRPRNDPTDRAFTAVVEAFEMPRALPDALLEGFAWDAIGRRYDDLSGVMDYSARVAAAVGAMMCVLMRQRHPDALARACDLGLAMQLTNIARDVGEDARAGRIYLPLSWLSEAGIDPAAFLADPHPDVRVRALVMRLLAEARSLYARSGAGIARLPLACRPGIHAARHIYGGIGGAIAANDHDSITLRARTGRAQKLGWLGLSFINSAASVVMPVAATLHAAPRPEVRFLVEAAARLTEVRARSDVVFQVLAQLETQDRNRASAPQMTRGGAQPG